MRVIQNFNEFIKQNIVTKRTPDISRAKFLIKEAENSYKLLQELQEKIPVRDDNANMFIKFCYDILMERIRAHMLKQGYTATGKGAHEAEVSYFRTLKFSETQVQFLNKLRYYRNGMLYYGTILDKEYAEKVIIFTKKTYLQLKKQS
jgi:hypothetical protein